MIPSPTAARQATLGRLAERELDVLVVGGGATGAGIARDAALRGLAVGLCEAGDFGGQTSSRSSKLIHGGLRYLQYGDFGLVFEGLAERRRLMTIAPHLCRPIEFVFPEFLDREVWSEILSTAPKQDAAGGQFHVGAKDHAPSRSIRMFEGRK